MKNYLLLPVLVGSLLLAGCGQKDQAAASAPAQAAPAGSAVEITANDTMKFNLTRFEVKAGQEVKVTFTNTGTMAKNVMGHNLVILKKGADIKAYADAAVTAMATEYIPAALADQVLAHSKLLGPKQSEELVFKAPTEPGEYPYVCTFPAHYLAGMKGVMVVQ